MYEMLSGFSNGSAKSSVIRQKGESENECSKKTKHTKFSEKTNISYPLIRTRTYVSSESLACFVFWKTCFEILPFALLPTKCHASHSMSPHPMQGNFQSHSQLSAQFLLEIFAWGGLSKNIL